MLTFFGTVWGQMVAQVAVAATSAAVQYASGHNFGDANAYVQMGAGVAAEVLAVIGGSKAASSPAKAAQTS